MLQSLQVGREDHRWRASLGEYGSRARQANLSALLHPLGEDSILIRLCMFALVAVGLHVGADRIDDHIFIALNAFDGGIDQLLSSAIQSVGGWLAWETERIQQVSFRAVDMISLSTKITASQYAALGCELLAVFMLAFPLLLPREKSPGEGYRHFTHRWWTDPSFARYGVPIAIAAASLSGVLMITTSTQGSTYAHLLEWTDNAALSRIGAQVFSGLTFLGVIWFVLIRCFEQILLRIDRRARNDIVTMVSKRRRRLRGFWRTLIALPVAVFGFIAAPAFIETINTIVGQ